MNSRNKFEILLLFSLIAANPECLVYVVMTDSPYQRLPRLGLSLPFVASLA